MDAKAPLVCSICAECGGSLEFPLGTTQVHCSYCHAGMAVDAGQHLVRLCCPRCGGNFYYLDGALCGRCPFCEAGLLAVTRDRLLRYLVRPAVAAPEPDARLLLLPFWHLSGLVYGWDLGKRTEMVDEVHDYQGEQARAGNEAEVIGRAVERRDSGPQRVSRVRVVSQSLADSVTLAHGVASLGVRASVFPVEPFSMEVESLGQVVAPALAPPQAREQLQERALDLAHTDLTHIEVQRADLVAETFSLFHYPYWVSQGAERKVWDAVSGQPERLAAAAPQPPSAGSLTFDELRIIELACTSCGAPLQGGNHARVLPCSGCQLHWEVTGQGLRSIVVHGAKPIQHLPDSSRIVFLPFWRVPVTLGYEGRQASRVRDLREVLGLHVPPSGLPSADPDSPLCYYVPAYGALRAPRMDVAARDMTLLQPALEEAPRSTGEVFNCFFGADDARRLGYATWMQFLPPMARRVRSLRISTGEVSLWYVPFAETERELQNLTTGRRYERFMFRGVRH